MFLFTPVRPGVHPAPPCKRAPVKMVAIPMPSFLSRQCPWAQPVQKSARPEGYPVVGAAFPYTCEILPVPNRAQQLVQTHGNSPEEQAAFLDMNKGSKHGKDQHS